MTESLDSVTGSTNTERAASGNLCFSLFLGALKKQSYGLHVRLYGQTISRLPAAVRLESNRFKDVWDIDALDHCTSFVINNERVFIRLWLLCNDTLLDSIHRFCASISCGQWTEVGLTKLVMLQSSGGTVGSRHHRLPATSRF